MTRTEIITASAIVLGAFALDVFADPLTKLLVGLGGAALVALVAKVVAQLDA